VLKDVSLGENGRFVHASRFQFNTRVGLLKEMREAKTINSVTLYAYLNPIVGGEAFDVVLFPMLHAYLLDPELLTRYNYGRGIEGYIVSEADKIRIQKARIWLERLNQLGYSTFWLEKLAQEIPHVGPYTAFANYIEMLSFLYSSGTSKRG
jgi:hypothetical protein